MWSDPPGVLAAVESIARQAGAVVMEVYASAFAVQGKADASPVTEADMRAQALIVPALQALLPCVPVVAEEAVSRGDVPAAAQRLWLVDPLDGTREFVARNGEFTVNIALAAARTATRPQCRPGWALAAWRPVSPSARR